MAESHVLVVNFPSRWRQSFIQSDAHQVWSPHENLPVELCSKQAVFWVQHINDRLRIPCGDMVI